MTAPPRVTTPAGLISATLAMAMACTAPAARAEEPALRFDVAAEPLASALLDFAVQARVSISTGGTSGCRGRSNRLAGRYRIQDALSELLKGTGCSFRIVADGAVVVFKASEPPPAAVHPPSSGPPPGPRPPGEARELIVTAARRTALIDRAPYSVSALTGEELAAGGATDIRGAASMVAGVSTTDLGPGRDKLFIRGLSDGALTGQAQSTVGIYLDGARITYNAPDPDLRLVDVQRLEVLRGPQGALYGAGSIAGILHIVTRKPQMDSFSGEIDGEVSAMAGGSPGRSVDGVLNAPLVAGRLALRVVGYDELQSGYIDDVRLKLHDVNEVRRRGYRAALRWTPAPDWTVSANVTRQGLNSSDTHYANPLLGPYARANFLREPHDNDFLAASVEVAGRQSWGALTATSSVMRHQFNSRYDASLALPLFAPGAAVAPSPFDTANRAELLVNEVTAASPDSGRLRWLLGVFQSVGDDDGDSMLTAPVGPSGAQATVYDEARHDLVRELAVYGQLSYRLAPRLTLTAGGRWFHNSVKTRSNIAQPLAGGQSAFEGKTAMAGFAPQVVLQDQLADEASVYLQVSEGYRAGGFNTAGLPGQAFSAGGAGPAPPRRYGGDELWNYEAGAKFALMGGRARIRTAAFYMAWKGVQSDQLLPNGLPYTANIGDGRDIGGEIEADVQPDAHWRFRANATAAEPELTRPRPAFAALDRNGLPGVPHVSAGVQASYRRPVFGSASLRLQADYAYVGRSHLTLDSRTSPAMGDYSTGRFSASLLGSRWNATAYVETPLGGPGNTFAYGDPFSFRVVRQTTPLRPLTVGLQLGVRIP